MAGKALSFDGLDDHVLVGTNASLYSTTDLTVSAWIRTASGDSQIIVTQRDASARNGLYILSLDGNYLQYSMRRASNIPFVSSGGADIATGIEWRHVEAVRSGGTHTVYINGRALTQTTTTSPVHLNQHLGVAIGADTFNNASFFDGAMDDVRIWNRALNDARVANRSPIYAAGTARVMVAEAGQDTRDSVAGVAFDADIVGTQTLGKVAGPDWATVTPEGLLDLTPGQCDVGLSTLTVASRDAAGASAETEIVLDVPGHPPVEVAYWNDLGGIDITDLTQLSRFPDQPDEVTTIASTDLPRNRGSNYGVRLRTLLVAPARGDYRFAVAADDASELWLAADAAGTEPTRIAFNTRYTSYGDIERQPSQISAPIALTAGSAYLLEGLFKEGGGNDHFTVFVTGPGLNLRVLDSRLVRAINPTTAVCGAVRYFSSGAAVPDAGLTAAPTEVDESASPTTREATSGADGSYRLLIPASEDTSVSVALSLAVDTANLARGVTGDDLLLVRNHILGTAPLDSAPKRLAADVNRDGEINVLDEVLMQRLISGAAAEYVTGQSLFEALPADLTFADPQAPRPFVATRQYLNQSAPVTDQDWLLIKLGDVDGDWNQ